MSTSFDLNSYRSSICGTSYQGIRAFMPKNDAFMVHSEDPVEVYVTHFDDFWHIVNPGLLDEGVYVPGLLQGYLYAAVTESGRPFVLVVTKPILARTTSWYAGWQRIIKIAREKFVEVYVNHDKKCHECKVMTKRGKPNWPEIQMEAWLATPFEKNRIDSKQHPIFGKRRRSYSQEGLEDFD